MLVTPPVDPGPVRLEDAKRLIGRIVVPVDLSPASRHQTQVAQGLAEALGVPLILVHVIEPLKSRLAARLHVAGIEADRRAVAEDGLSELVATVPPRVHREALVAYGDPAEELAKVARDRHAGLVRDGSARFATAGSAHGLGDVSRCCACRTTLVLALPPRASRHRARSS